MSSPGQDDGERLSSEDGRATPTQQLEQTPEAPESFSRIRPQFAPSSDSGPSVPRSESSGDPFVAQPASSPADQPGASGVRTPPLQRSPSPRPATTPGRIFLSPIGALRNWLSPPAKTAQQQQQDPTPEGGSSAVQAAPWGYGLSTTPFVDETGGSLIFGTSFEPEALPSEAGRQGSEDSVEGTTEVEEPGDTQGAKDEPSEEIESEDSLEGTTKVDPDSTQAAEGSPDAGENLELSGVGLGGTLYAAGSSRFPRPGFPQPGSRRGSRRTQEVKDDYNFESEYLISHVRAEAFGGVFQKIEDERVFQDARLLESSRHYARTREPNIGSQALDGLYNESNRAMRAWLERNRQDFTQKLQDKILNQMEKAVGVMRTRVGDLLGEEEEYIKVTANNLEALITRPVGRNRSNTSGGTSSVASEYNYQELTPEQLRSLPRKELLLKCVQAQQQVTSLQDTCNYLEIGNADLEQSVRQLEDANRDLKDTEEERVNDRIQSLAHILPGARGIPIRDTESQPSSAGARATRTRSTPPASTSSGRSPRLPGTASSTKRASASMSASATVDSPRTPGEITAQTADRTEATLRAKYIGDLENLYIELRLESEIIPFYIRQVSEEVNIPLRAGLEERSESEVSVPVATSPDSLTPRYLLARLHQATLERDRARRGELGAQEQLRSLQQPDSNAPTGLIGQISNALMGGRQSDSTPTATPSTTAPLTASLNHPTVVRLLRIASQLAEELSGCALATSNLAQTMARCGGMNKGRSPVPLALTNMRAVVRTLRGDKPGTPTGPDLAGGSDVWQSLYLDDMEAYMLQVRRNVVAAINTLDDSVVDWGRLNQRGSTPSSGRASASLPTGNVPSLPSTGRNWATLAAELDQASSQGGSQSIGSPAGASVREQDVAVNLQPLIQGNWPQSHPLYPCDFCKPVLQLPTFAAGLRDARDGGCTCGPGDVVEGKKAEGTTKSQGSPRSVTFADEKPGLVAGKREKRRPSRLDLSKAGSSASNEGSDRPSTPHPSKSTGDRSSSLRSSGRAAPTSQNRSDCNCLCRRGQVQVAYYTCRNMSGQPADEAPSRPRTSGGSKAGPGFQAPSERPRSIERWLLDVATDVASIVGWASPRVSRNSPGSAAQDPTQIPSPSLRKSSSRSPFPNLLSFRQSPRTPSDRSQAQAPQGHTPPPDPRRTPVFPDVPGRRTRRATAPANFGALTRLPEVPEAEIEDNNDPAGPRTPAEMYPDSGRAGSGNQQPDIRTEPVMTTFLNLLLNDPLLAILTLLWDVILFFTFEQMRNTLIILWFLLSGVWYYIRLALYSVLRFLARQNVLRPESPVLPRAAINSLLACMAFVWISAMTIALNEERRIWGSTNPQVTVSYYRGMPYRRLYPWWSMYLVDTDLVGPALGGLSESLHGLVFASNLAKLGLNVLQ